MILRPSAGDGSVLEWYKSSYSTDDGPACVEIATTPGTIHVRGSKNTHGPQLSFGPATWAEFIACATGS
ncbi:DUF397 domain-containing protein [Streptomyces sp. CA-135486]|uniref:DUF397 domain-containing protein n=1 Tax=Streptomyces sp. CA-135486 TaxID=3240049 RepID=UPI003D949D09